MASQKTERTFLIAVIGDQPTVTGLLLTGMGQRNGGKQNFMILENNTTDDDIEQALRGYLARPDIGIVLISQGAAERVRNVIVEHEAIIPTILEIPGDDAPYDPEKDTIVVRAACVLWGGDVGRERLKTMNQALMSGARK